MSARPWLDIFVLCHNRPDKAKAAIASIVAQSERGYRLIVSDNSSDGRVAAMMGENFPDLELRQRGCVPALMHFIANQINQRNEIVSAGKLRNSQVKVS